MEITVSGLSDLSVETLTTSSFCNYDIFAHHHLTRFFMQKPKMLNMSIDTTINYTGCVVCQIKLMDRRGHLLSIYPNFLLLILKNNLKSDF